MFLSLPLQGTSQCTAMCPEGAEKLGAVQVNHVGTCAMLLTQSRLCVTDVCTGFRFLVDTGANISVLPVTKKCFNSVQCSDYKVYAANGTKIITYGTKSMILDLRLRRQYKWTFIVADVKQPILGADFLSHYGYR